MIKVNFTLSHSKDVKEIFSVVKTNLVLILLGLLMLHEHELLLLPFGVVWHWQRHPQLDWKILI